MKIIYLIVFMPIALLAQEDNVIEDELALPIFRHERLDNWKKPHAKPEKKQHTPASPFTIIAPHGIRSGKPFNVAVRGFRLKRSMKLKLIISGTADTGEVVKIRKLAEISKFKPKALIQFTTINIQPGSYKLSVISDDYSEEKDLTYITNQYSFLIMADKSLYFPEDLIRFRIFATDSETKAINPKLKTDVFIKDESGSIVATIPNATFLKGKFEGEWKLSSRPSLGFWQIEVQSEDDTASKTIELAEYSIPLIYVELKVPQSIPFSYGIIPIAVKAKYSFNEEVDGMATVIFERFGTEYFRKVIEIGENVANFDVDLAKELKAVAKQIFSYDVRLEYHDQFTNSTVVESTTFDVLPYSYSIYLYGDSYIRPGRDFQYSVVVQKYDGSPAPSGKKVKVTLKSSDVTQTLDLDENGFAESAFAVPIDATSFTIVAKADDTESASYYAGLPLPLEKSVNKTSAKHFDDDKPTVYMQLSVLTKRPSINSPVQIELILSEYIDKVICLIAAKGVLLELVEIPIIKVQNQPFQSATFTFNPNFAYTPVANLLAYYVRRDGRIITAVGSVELSSQLRNQLSFTFTQEEVKPGENIDLQVESSMYSTVSMTAVDQRILALRGGNDVTKTEVFDGLLKYYRAAPYDSSRRLPDYEYSFNNNGFIIFTNIPNHPDCFHYKNEPKPYNTLDASTNTPEKGYKIIKTPQKFGNSIFWRNVDIKTPSPGRSENKLGRESITEIAPQELSSYVVTGMSMSSTNGIGLPDLTPSIKVFRPFFIAAEFPYSIKRTETLVQTFIFYNFLKTSMTFDVKIKKDPKYKMKSTNFGWTESGDYYIRTLTTDVGIHSRIQFSFEALEIGTINFKISAHGPLVGDEIDRVIRVVPVGMYKESVTSSTFLIQNNDVITRSISCNVPQNAMDIMEIKAIISGDILARPLTYLPTGLIHEPAGCGEQNLLYMAPDAAVYNYLMFTDQMSDDLLMKLIDHLYKGYQNQLRYLRRDGGFSAWGESTPGSTWLTAYAGWTIHLSRDVINIDMNVIKLGLEFLSTKQRSEGYFVEDKALLYDRKMQGGSADGIAMTAFVAIYIHRVLPDFPEYADMHQKVIQYLENNWWRKTDSYELAIIGYALKLAGSEKADNVINFFYMRRIETATEIRYDNIETTAYCLLILLVKGERYGDAVKIVNYLIRVSNRFGGYFYSQDTVIAMYALGLFGSRYPAFGRIDLTIQPNIGDQFHETIDSEDPMFLATIPLDINARSLEINAVSNLGGKAIVTLVCAYHEESLEFQPAFDIYYQFSYTCRHQIYTTIFVKFLHEEQSGMAIVTIILPSGFVYNEIIDSPDVRKVEVNKDGAEVNFYFDHISNNYVPITLRAIRSNFVDEVKAGHIKVIDYYEKSNEAFATFVLPDLTNSCGIVFRKK